MTEHARPPSRGWAGSQRDSGGPESLPDSGAAANTPLCTFCGDPTTNVETGYLEGVPGRDGERVDTVAHAECYERARRDEVAWWIP